MRHQDLDRRSLELHRLVAEKLRRDPALLERAAAILARWRKNAPPQRVPYFGERQQLIEAGVEACLAVATEESERATALRQCSPLSCLLEPDERLRFLAEWYGYRGAEAEHWIKTVREAEQRALGER